jgi:hypothetical protein
VSVEPEPTWRIRYGEPHTTVETHYWAYLYQWHRIKPQDIALWRERGAFIDIHETTTATVPARVHDAVAPPPFTLPAGHGTEPNE